jgi:hypothetical protein
MRRSWLGAEAVQMRFVGGEIPQATGSWIPSDPCGSVKSVVKNSIVPALRPLATFAPLRLTLWGQAEGFEGGEKKRFSTTDHTDLHG